MFWIQLIIPGCFFFTGFKHFAMLARSKGERGLSFDEWYLQCGLLILWLVNVTHA